MIKESLTFAYLDNVQARLASLRELQSKTQEELDALLSSGLDKVVKSELWEKTNEAKR